ncbi:MAG: hypothetical protein KGI69_00150 [Patescibacteria group bacterium]|nr:hypothetical protein [Patescibacteria group bacterium]
MANNTEHKDKRSYGSASASGLDKSRVEIEGSIPAEIWEACRAEALKNINGSVSIDGFRKGSVPENVLISKVGEQAILEEMAEIALPKAYLDILIDHGIDAIGRPSVRITKLAKGNALEFKAVTAVAPKVALPDYKKIAAAELKKPTAEEIEATDADIEEAVLRLRKAHASHEGHDHASMTPEEHEKAVMASLPAFDDEFVRGLGGDFKDVADFKAKARDIIKQGKADAAREKARIRLADALTDATKIDLPDILVESELDRTQAQFSADVERMGVSFEDYLKHSKKSVEDIRKEWLPHAEKKAKLQLILNAIGAAESIVPDPGEVEAEVEHIVSHYKDADREQAAEYAQTVLANEAIFRFLEKIAG